MMQQMVPSRKGKKNTVKCHSLKDSYSSYRETTKSPVSLKVYKEVIGDLNKDIMQYLMEGGIFTMPYRLGIIRIKKIKNNLNNLKIDFKHYLTTGQKIYHLNDHSNGYYYRWLWDKYKAGVIIKNKGRYKFVFSRANKRALAKLIKEGNDYAE